MGRGAYILNVAFSRTAPRKVTFVYLRQNGTLVDRLCYRFAIVCEKVSSGHLAATILS